MEPLRGINIKAAVNRINDVLRELELNDTEIKLIMECYNEVLNQRDRKHAKLYSDLFKKNVEELKEFAEEL